ncbi:repressor LexA [bacterium]|nr:repressor LexA [bacterium]
MENNVNYVMDNDPTGIPILGKVAAGTPRFSENVDMGFLTSMQAKDMARNKNIFALQIVGDSMIEDGIYDGNYIVVRYTTEFANGDIVIAYVNEEATVKRIYKRGSKIVLQPANSELEPIEIDPAFSEFRVGGKIIDVIRN